MDLSTIYAGLKLSSPVIVAASSLTSAPENVKQCEKFGAGAVVLKSLYEEQIAVDKRKLDSQEDMYFWFPDAAEYIDKNAKEEGLNNYLDLVKDCKKEVDIPVIASINCISAGLWLEYVDKIEKAGADALELNVFIPPTNPDISGGEIEKQYLAILKNVIGAIQIPVTLKIGFYFSNPANMIKQLDDTGINGLVLFNRYFRPDIDIQNLRVVSTNVLSDPHEITMGLRWIALMADHMKADLCATTGIHDADGVIKQLLCGASAVQIASVLYERGIEYIEEITKGIHTWMKEKNYNRITDFKGIMTDLDENKVSFERVHYIQKSLGMVI